MGKHKHGHTCECEQENNINPSTCNCEGDCTCGDTCECGDTCTCEECNCNETNACNKTCDCCEECDCGDNCTCDEQTKCNENCTCDQHGKNEVENCQCCDDRADYLTQLQRVQAEFDNYRKRMVTALGDARQDGFMDAIEQFLPALDSFKMASAMITDKNTLIGIQFIEKGILNTLSKMGVETIDATGKFDPELHQAIDTEDAPGFESGDIVKECYKGFTYKGKVIRYSQVIVKK